MEEPTERAICWAYSRYFSRKFREDEDDLKQEARLAMFLEGKKLSEQEIGKYAPKIAMRAMIAYVRKRYHQEAKSGYLETQADFPIIAAKDYSLDERLLFMDIGKVLCQYNKESREALITVLAALYVGFGFSEIASIVGSDRGNIWKKSVRFGRRLVSAWS